MLGLTVIDPIKRSILLTIKCIKLRALTIEKTAFLLVRGVKINLPLTLLMRSGAIRAVQLFTCGKPSSYSVRLLPVYRSTPSSSDITRHKQILI